MDILRIDRVDVTDSDQLVIWNEVLRDGYNAGREAAWWRSPEATVAQYRSPKPGRVSVALLAACGDQLLGAAEGHADPGEPAEVEISVLPAYRRGRVGLALTEAMRDALTGHADRVQVETYSDAGVAFAQHLGLRTGITESRQLLDLPISHERLTGLARPVAGVELTSWVGRCPDDLVHDRAMLTTQMNADVPVGELTRTTRVTDEAVIRQQEERMRAQGYAVVNSLARIDGHSVGYTEILISRHNPEIVNQDDTFVERAHRGRGIGRLLKIANLRQLMQLPEAGRSRWVQTYTALTNRPMLALNHAIGFREVDVMTVLEL